MIDKNKQYTTRSGLPVEIYATDRGGEYPVHGAILEHNEWSVRCWTYDGRFVQSTEHFFDLIEVKPRIVREVWINVYDKQLNGAYYEYRSDADHWATADRLACVKVTIDCDEGEGL